MSHAAPETGSRTPDTKTYLHLTESIFTLQQTIKNIIEDVHNNIAPSIILPTNEDVDSGMMLLTLDPSPVDILTHLNPLSDRLSELEKSLRARSQWHPPTIPPKSPEYSIIDIADLSSAIQLLEDIAKHSSPSKPLSPQAAFSKYEWIWDPIWKEFYAPTPEAQIYLSKWRLDKSRNVWYHVNSNNHLGNGGGIASVLGGPDEAAQLLGSWEDWTWDAIWKEWYLDVSSLEEGESRVYASKWEVREDGEWRYVGRMGGQ